MSEQRVINMVEARPHTNSNFLVDLGLGDPQSSHGGFCEVIFPEFRIESVRRTSPEADQGSDRFVVDDASRHLILRRGATGVLDLYNWWNRARKGTAPKQRTVKISLLAADHATVVFTWYFRQARPVSLSYSSLNALHGTILIETIALEFTAMEMR